VLYELHEFCTLHEFEHLERSRIQVSCLVGVAVSISNRIDYRLTTKNASPSEMLPYLFVALCFTNDILKLINYFKVVI